MLCGRQPWLTFEPRALAYHVQAARVVPLCIDIAPAKVAGPPAAFQGRKLDSATVRQHAEGWLIT